MIYLILTLNNFWQKTPTTYDEAISLYKYIVIDNGWIPDMVNLKTAYNNLNKN